MMLEMKIATWLGILNTLILLAVMYFSYKSYRKLKADYTLFVIIFAGLFVLQYLINAYFFFTNMDFYSLEVSRNILALTVLQTIAFGYLLWMELQ